ncbi:Ig-like domain-containing protein [Bacteriovorax sp. PP10]|uniref:Ig-like domain-containing protein n=1 Tax=Bacteriovorax antarcticus TaxID=3088717 RepID=A0ABU5VZL5_9BACT|nr:Ig-like domain-containing protein [Bacteriovorax sp. PP10]MEA9358513.1 Ig-like domain-containing protein [Bacteriovorax sp. PP10]
MSSTKSFINTFMLAIATLAITSCVPKATEKKAACGVNQAFSSVSRSCYSIEELRTKPVGTTATVSMDEEISKTITLAYTDGNKDKAVSCKIIPTSTSLEMIAPSVADGGLFRKADEVYLNASNIATALGGPLLVSEVAMRTALDKAKASQYYPTVAAQLVVFKTQATSIIGAGLGITNNVVVLSNYMAGQENLLAFTPMMTNMSNRCECSGGVCSTLAIPKANKSGTTGFSYTVTDVDGEGAAKATVVTVAAMSKSTAHLKPVAQSGFYNLYESNTSTATAYNITIPAAADITGVNSAMKYYFDTSDPSIATKVGDVGWTAKGKITGCMDLQGSGGLTDRTCIYTPANPDKTLNGDLFDINTPVKAVTPLGAVGNLRFTAVAEGTAANSFTVQFFDLRDKNLLTNNIYVDDSYITAPQIYGLVGGAEEAFIRVAGNAIKIFINPAETTETQIQDLVNNHKQASLMVRASGAMSVAPATTASPIPLSGGVDAYDKVPFYVNNLLTNSANKSFLSFKINQVDDVPAMDYLILAEKTVDEDLTPILVNLASPATYTDSDTDLVAPFNYTNICEVTTIDVLHPGTNFVAYGCTCALNVCTASLTPTPNASSTAPFTFQYRIGSVSAGVTQYTPYRDFKLTITPINDAPEISATAITTLTPATPLSTIAQPQIINEGSSGTLTVYVGPGGSGYESQNVTLAATSSDPILFPSGSIVIADAAPLGTGKKLVTFTPKSDQSGTATITFTATDNGNPTAPNVNVFSTTYIVKVKAINNPPYFRSAITKVETNEGGAVQSDGFVIDEDVGSSTDENAQYVTIESLVSDNTNVLPISAIRIFYDLNDNGVEDSGEERCAVNQAGCLFTTKLEAANTDDVKSHKFYLKLDPVDGISGNANVTMTLSDHIDTTAVTGDPLYLTDNTYGPLTTSVVTNFSFIVHPTAALHGGWNNISSVGLKTDKNGAPVAVSEIQCNYNKAPATGVVEDLKACSGASCTQAYSPTGTIVPDAANVIFWDSTAKRCYRSTGTTAFSWVDFNTSCPISRTPTDTGICSGNNCINISAIPKATGLFRYDTATNTCYVSNGTTSISDWDVKYVPAKVTLAWKPFIMVGSGADSNVQTAGWNVYRREAGTDYNFKGGHLKSTTAGSTANFTIPDPSIRTFTDTTAIAGKVYYYVVRPVDNLRLFPTYTPEIFSEARVIASPQNYTFVHRWMINQEICNSMNMTATTTPNSIDQSHNFRCPYAGPGEATVTVGAVTTALGYYDYGRDVLVDTQELGCPYAKAPKCSANGCIGIGAPTDTGDLLSGDLYYDRSSGSCYAYDLGVFTNVQSAGLAVIKVLVDKFNTALNAPLVNVGQSRAVDICAARTSPVLYRNDGMTVAVDLGTHPILPSKKDYNAYAAQRSDITDPEVTELEQGYSLNIQSRCNGSAASGLETAFTDSSIPSTSFIYSIPGTFSSGIRSLYTGSIAWGSSKGTESCISRYGIQDLYGNVAEWTSDRMTCPLGTHSCTSSGSGSSFEYVFDSQAYGLDNITGPYNDSDGIVGPSATDADLTSWIFGDQFFTASKYSFPVGLPISSNITTDNASKLSPAIAYLLDIGPSSGITTNKLHEDGFIPNMAAVRSSSTVIAAVTYNGIGGLAVGGSYLSGNLAGRYTTEVIPVDNQRKDVGLRCIIPVKSYNTGDTQYNYPEAL